MSVDTSGGMASDAVRLVKAIGEEGERLSLGAWGSGEIERQLLGAVAVAVQRGNALAVMTGFARATADARGRRAGKSGSGMDVAGWWKGR